MAMTAPQPGLPYFPFELAANQLVLERVPFMISALIAARRDDEPFRMLEVGSWLGGSLMIWAEAIARYCPAGGEIWCVDPWTPYADPDDHDVPDPSVYAKMTEAAQSGKALEAFRHNAGVAQDAFGVTVHERRGPSRDVLPDLPDDAFDLVFIDGSHAYDDVVADLRNGKRLVRADGILCGDDMEWAAEDLTEDETAKAWAERNKDLCCLERGCFSPGVTFAVAEELGAVARYYGFFAARRNGTTFTPESLTNIRAFAPRFWDDTAVNGLKHFLTRLQP